MADDAPRIGLEKAGKSQGSSSSPDGVAGGAGGAAAGGRTSPPSAAAELRGEAGGEPWKLGACYNVFDGEELLEYSIRSVRPTVSYVVVVFQEGASAVSPCAPPPCAPPRLGGRPLVPSKGWRLVHLRD